MQFAEVLHYFLTDGHQAHWPKIVELARKDTEKADKELTEYFMEAHRLTSEQVFKRTVKPKIIGGQASREKVKIGHNTFEPKQDIILLLVSSPALKLYPVISHKPFSNVP